MQSSNSMLWHSPPHKMCNGGSLNVFYEKKSHETRLKQIKDRHRALRVAKSSFKLMPGQRNEELSVRFKYNSQVDHHYQMEAS